MMLLMIFWFVFQRDNNSGSSREFFLGDKQEKHLGTAKKLETSLCQHSCASFRTPVMTQ